MVHVLEFCERQDDGTRPQLRDNTDSWLSFTDLVLIDPVGTGWSRAASNEDAKSFYGVRQDAESLAKVIALFRQKNGRMPSPKYLVGERYGGFRAAKVASALKETQGVLVSGIVMISPMIEGRFLWRTDDDPLTAALRLPSLAAAEPERNNAFDPNRVDEAERFAMTDYLVSLAGPQLRGASSEVAELLDVTEAYIRQISLKEKGPTPEVTANGRRLYTLEQVLELRMYLSENGRKKWMNPRRIEGEGCQIIAVTNFKGGSSKTSTTIHLAYFLALKGYRVPTLDLDPQASLTSLHGSLSGFDVREGETLYSAIRFEDPVPTKELIHKTHIAGLDVICAGLDLTEFETSVALEMRKNGGTSFLLRVSQALEQVVDDYDVILMDSAPSLNFLTLSSLTAATGVLIPVPAHMLDVDSTGKLLELAASYMQILSDMGTSAQWDFAKFIVTKFEPNDHPQANMTALMRQVFGEDLLLNMIIKSAAVADALTWKQSLYEVQRTRFSAPKTYDRAMESINAANAEIENLLWRSWGRE